LTANLLAKWIEKDCMIAQITKEWHLELGDEFESRAENNQRIFWKPGITVAAIVFSLPQGADKLTLLNQIHEKMPNNVLETLVSTKGEVVGLGYTQVLKESKNKTRLSLTAFIVSDTSCLQIGFYLDDPDDLPWAKSVWESIRYVPTQ